MSKSTRIKLAADSLNQYRSNRYTSPPAPESGTQAKFPSWRVVREPPSGVGKPHEDGLDHYNDGRNAEFLRAKLARSEEEMEAGRTTQERDNNSVWGYMQSVETRLQKLENESRNGKLEPTSATVQDGKAEQGIWHVDEKEERLKEAESKLVTMQATNQMLFDRLIQLEAEKKKMTEERSEMMAQIKDLKGELQKKSKDRQKKGTRPTSRQTPSDDEECRPN